MARARWTASGDNILRWMLPATVLHAGTALFAAALTPSAPVGSIPLVSGVPVLPAPVPELSLELTLLVDGEASVATPSVLVAPSPPQAAARMSSAPTAPNSTPQATASLQIVGSATPALPGRNEPPVQAPAAEEPARSPALSLDQLGIGGSNPFLGVAVQPLTKEEQASARLHAALHPPSVERQRQDLGPAGPVAAAARRLVLDDDSLVETSAVFNVSVDGSGRVTGVHVLDASSEIDAWQLIAARLARALGAVKLRADSGQSWGMKLRLASSVQLPSGAAPGMRIGVLGQQVAGSGGPSSTSLELSPTSKLDLREIEQDSAGRHMDQPILFEAMLLKLRADPTDIGAAARRVVEVALLSIDTPPAP